jgi:lipoprotein-releasing system ATP-binding protein
MNNSETVLSTNNITKHYYYPIKFKVLHDVSFEVRRGEFLSLVGKSGCGKSTLLYCLSTMDTDYEGEVYILGEKVTGRKTDDLAHIRNKNIGFIFQFHYLLPEFSCLKNVMIPALKLSGGQQQRVAIARSLINDPKIIMCDEPTGNLDSKNTQIVFDIFKQLAHDYNQTIIAVTHDNDFAKASDRTMEMGDGKILSTHKIYEN